MKKNHEQQPRLRIVFMTLRNYRNGTFSYLVPSVKKGIEHILKEKRPYYGFYFTRREDSLKKPIGKIFLIGEVYTYEQLTKMNMNGHYTELLRYFKSLKNQKATTLVLTKTIAHSWWIKDDRIVVLDQKSFRAVLTQWLRKKEKHIQTACHRS